MIKEGSGLGQKGEKFKGERIMLKKWSFCEVTTPALPLTLDFLQYFHNVRINFLGLCGGRELINCPGLYLAHSTGY